MASAFARSARRKDEDDLRKDHRKREDPPPGDQFAKRRDNTIAGALEVNEEMRALKTKPGKGVQSKDIHLPAPKKVGPPLIRDVYYEALARAKEGLPLTREQSAAYNKKRKK